VTELEAAVAEREETVAADIRERIGGMRVGDEGDKGEKDDEADEAATGTVAGAVAAVSDAAFLLSLARGSRSRTI